MKPEAGERTRHRVGRLETGQTQSEGGRGTCMQDAAPQGRAGRRALREGRTHSPRAIGHMKLGRYSLKTWHYALTRAVLVACVFRVVLGGGGVFTPPLTRLLGHVATRGKRQSKERQK